MKIKNCEHCGDRYSAKKVTQKYCSSTCRVKACQERNNYEYKVLAPKKNRNTEIQGIEIENKDSVFKEIPEQKSEGKVLDSFAGAGMALLADKALTSLLTQDEDKTITVKQMKEIVLSLHKKINSHDKMILDRLNYVIKQNKELLKRLDDEDLL